MTNIISNFAEWKENVNSKFNKPFENPPSSEYFSLFEEVFDKHDKFMCGPVAMVDSICITAASIKTPSMQLDEFRTHLQNLRDRGFIPYRFFVTPGGDIVLRGGKI